MAMDATMQIRMDSALKEKVEKLYKNMGTSFAEAVRMFAQQSVAEGAMPFRPQLQSTDNLTLNDVDNILAASKKDVANDNVYTLDEVVGLMEKKYAKKQAV